MNQLPSPSSLPITAQITVIGHDRAGVVAQVTQVLFQTGANLEEVEQQVTRGMFSMFLLATWETLDREALLTSLQDVGRQLGMEIRTRFLHQHTPQRLALLVTREAECPAAILQAVRSGAIPAEVALMAGNHAALRPLAEQYGVPFFEVDYSDRHRAEQEMLCLIEEQEADYVVLARFMKILSPSFVWRHRNKIINIHPSLLPAFPGANAYRQAYERGVKIAGVTAHFVTMDLDEGPIIAQEAFVIPPGAGLAEIIALGRQHEASTLVRAVQLCLERKLDVHWGVVHEIDAEVLPGER